MEHSRHSQAILIVEDSVDDYEFTERILRKLNVMNPIEWCQGGSECLAYLEKKNKFEKRTSGNPRIILLDLNMPGLNGQNVLKKIKANDAFKNIPVIILTTSNRDIDVDDCYGAGANSFIQKPVDLRGFMQIIESMKKFWLDVALLPQ